MAFHENNSAQGSNLKARFLSDGERDMIELSFLDSKDVVVRPVEPQDLAKWPLEWSAFDSRRPKLEMTGTPLTEIPGLSRETAMALRLKGVASVEKLAALDDFAVHALGDLGETWRASAQLVMQAKELAELKAAAARQQKKAA